MRTWKISRQPVFNADLMTVGYQLFFYDIDPAFNSETGLIEFHRFFNEEVLIANLVGKTQLHFGFSSFELALLTPEQFTGSNCLISFDINWLINKKMMQKYLDFGAKKIRLEIQLSSNLATLPKIIDTAELIKVDAGLLTATGMKPKIASLLDMKKPLLAQKVQTNEQFLLARAMGFTYFHGQFIGKVCRQKKLTEGQTADKFHTLKLIIGLNQADLTFPEVAELIAKIPTLTSQLLTACNCKFINLGRKITNINEAVSLIGLIQVQHLASMVLYHSLEIRPKAILIQTFSRAKHCELLAEIHASCPKTDYFIVGLLSNLPVLFERPLDELLPLMPLTEQVVQALKDQSGELGAILRLVLAYEQSDWDEIKHPCYTVDQIAASYKQSLHWVDQFEKEFY